MLLVVNSLLVRWYVRNYLISAFASFDLPSGPFVLFLVSLLKSFVVCDVGVCLVQNTISAVNPLAYGNRFIRFLESGIEL